MIDEDENVHPKETELIRIENASEWLPQKLHRDKPDSDTRRILSTLPLFVNLSSRDWRELNNLFHNRTYKNDEVIFRYGTPGLGMYIIIEGTIAILARENETDIEIARLGPGDFFGEMTLIEEADRSATAVSIGDSRLMGIFRPQLRDLLNRRPRLGMIIMERLARIVVKRLQVANHRLAEYHTTLRSGEME